MSTIYEIDDKILRSNNELASIYNKIKSYREKALPKLLSDRKYNDNLANENIERWGANNLYPQMLSEAIDYSPVLQAGLEKAINLTYGQGPYMYKQIRSKENNLSISEVIDDDLQNLFINSRIAEYCQKAISDFRIYAQAFAVFRINEAKQICRIEIVPAPQVRYAKPNKKGIIDEVIISKLWATNKNNTAIIKSNLDTYIKDGYAIKLPLLSVFDTIQDLKNKIDDGATAFVYPLSNYSANANPYCSNALQACYNAGWLDIARLVPMMKNKSMNSAISLKMAVGYNVDDFPEYFGIPSLINQSNSIATPKSPGLDPATKKQALQAFQDEIKDNLVGVENHDTTMFYPFKYTDDGKIVKALEFVSIEKNVIDKELINDAMHSHSILLESIGVDMTLIGHGLPGSSMGSGASGSNKRVAMQVFQTESKLLRDLILTPFVIAQQFNEMDLSVKIAFKDLEITTLNENPNGIQNK